MNQTSRTIAKNAGVLMLSQLLTWSFSLLLTIFLPRYLGPTGVGQYHLATSLWTLAVVVAAFGMDLLLTKEIARDPARTAELFGTSLILRVGLYVLSIAGMLIYVRLAGYPPQTVAVIAVVGVSSFIVLIANACEASLRGLERMEFISLGSIVSRAVVTAGTMILLFTGRNVVVIAAFGFVGALVNLLIQFFALRRFQPLSLRFDRELARWMLRASVPYLLVYVFLVLYQQVDIVVISLLVKEEGVGWYGAADQLFGTLLFIPTVFMTAVFPALSRMYATGSDALPRLMSRSFNLLLLVSVPIGLGVLVIADSFVIMLFGPEFANSGPILAILGIVLILTYMNILLGQFIISIDKQKVWTWVMAVAFLATIPLDLILVPWCQSRFGNGAIGGALAFVVTEAGMMIFGLRYLPQGALNRSNAWYAARVLAAGALMVAATWWARDRFIGLPIAVGAGAYAGAILALRVVPAEDWQLARQVGQGLLSRLRARKAQPVI